MTNALVYSVNGNQKYVDNMVNSINSFYANNNLELLKTIHPFILTDFAALDLSKVARGIPAKVVDTFSFDYSNVRFKTENDMLRFTKSAYYRWEIFNNPLFKEFDNVLYLDCDTVVNAPLDELFTIRKVPKIRMVEEIKRDWIVKRYEELGLKLKHYCNSGVILFNPKWFSGRLLTRFFQRLVYEAVERPERYADQDSINQALATPEFADLLELLPGEYNYEGFTKQSMTPGSTVKIQHNVGQ